MNPALPNSESYPKTVMLRDGAEVTLRPLQGGDKVPLLEFFKHVPEEDRYYLKENVTSPGVIHELTSNIDFDRIIPIVGLAKERIVADATLHRSRAMARHHLGEMRVVVDPAYREVGLGRRLIREMLDIAADLGLHTETFELVSGRESPAINAASSVGFKEIATLPGRIKDFWGNYQDLVLLEMPLSDRHQWWY